MIKEVGVRSVIQLARVLGISTPLEYDYTIALGSNGTKLYEITRAYGAFANGGYVVQPYAIESVETSRGKVVYRAPKAKASHQLSYNTAAVMTAMLKNVIKSGTGAAANIGKPAAGKPEQQMTTKMQALSDIHRMSLQAYGLETMTTQTTSNQFRAEQFRL